MRSRRLVGAASTLLLLILLRAAGAEMPPPGTVITAENRERYREALFPTALAMDGAVQRSDGEIRQPGAPEVDGRDLPGCPVAPVWYCWLREFVLPFLG